MGLIQAQKSLGRTIKNVGRLKSIVAVLAKYGFQDVVQRIKLSPYIPTGKKHENLVVLTQAQRLRMCLEELGPTFIKFGQVLSTRSDILPKDYVMEFKKLQDHVPPVSFSSIKEVLRKQYGDGFEEIFHSINEKSLGSASIAQVHEAKLIDGTEVVLKVRKPGIEKTINDDVGILLSFGDLAERYLPELESLNLKGLIEEFCISIQMETNFTVEANNVRRFIENFKDSSVIKIPRVYMDYSSHSVLVLEKLAGIPMSDPRSLEQEGISREQIMRAGMEAYFNMVFKDGLFHGDLHAGNLFILPESKVGLIDFGMVGRLSKKYQTIIANMFIALATEDYERLAYEYAEMAPIEKHVDVDDLARDLRALLSPFFGLTLSHVNLGRILLDSTSIATAFKIRVPSELMMFFKSMVTVEGLGRMIMEDFNILPYVKEFSGDLIKTKFNKTDLFQDASLFIREANALAHSAPRDLRQLLRRLNHPSYRSRLEVEGFKEYRRELSNASSLQFLAIMIGSLVIGGALALPVETNQYLLGIPMVSAVMFSIATTLGALTFYHYIRK